MALRWLYFSARGRLGAKAFRQTYLGLFVVSVLVWAAVAAEAQADEAIVRFAQDNGAFLGAMALASATSLGFLAWVALAAGTDEPNAYGEHSISIVR